MQKLGKAQLENFTPTHLAGIRHPRCRRAYTSWIGNISCFLVLKSLTTIAIAGGAGLDPMLRSQAIRYLLLGWRLDDIANKIHCHPVTIYRIHRSLWIRGRPLPPSLRARGAPKKLTLADEDTLLEWLSRNPTTNQEEIAWFLWEERSIYIH